MRNDKLIVIAIIQNTLVKIQGVACLPVLNKTQDIVLRVWGTALLDIYFSITGNQWTDNMQNLTLWMLKYIKDEARVMEVRN